MVDGDDDDDGDDGVALAGSLLGVAGSDAGGAEPNALAESLRCALYAAARFERAQKPLKTKTRVCTRFNGRGGAGGGAQRTGRFGRRLVERRREALAKPRFKGQRFVERRNNALQLLCTTSTHNNDKPQKKKRTGTALDVGGGHTFDAFGAIRKAATRRAVRNGHQPKRRYRSAARVSSALKAAGDAALQRTAK